MDSIGALALATEPPTEDVLLRPPINAAHPKTWLVNPNMMKNIGGQAIYQVSILMAGVFLLPYIPNLSDCRNPDGTKVRFLSTLLFEPTCQLTNEFARVSSYTHAQYLCNIKLASEEHYTMIFNTFVYCQIFNEINARKVDGTLNVFSGILNNYLFVAIIFIEAGMQAMLVEVPGLNSVFHCTHLTWREWLLCLGVGAFSLIIGVVLNLMTPWFPKDRVLTAEDYEGLATSDSEEELDEVTEKFKQ